MDGICFEAALELSGQTFILREQAHLDGVYQQIDDTNLCDSRIPRRPFDFSGGRAVAGVWTYAATGCTARHTASEIVRDEAASTIALRYFFETEGACPYELIRPLWVSIENTDGFNIIFEIDRQAG